ncbi:MAG: THUMP domain-containing protein [Candidatus Bathyarchaeia archaeon]
MIRDFNLLVSCPRMRESDACTEVWFLLSKIGDREIVVEKSEVSGLLVAKTNFEPFKVIAELRRLLREQPQEFRYILRVVPIEVVVPTRLELIKKTSLELSARIGESETFRVTVEKRHSSFSSREIIEAVAEGINRKVDLVKPDRIVLIEVVGGLTGVSVIKPEDVLSIVKEKV